MANSKITRMLTLELTLEDIYAVLDEDWLYDLLPGDGQDDYILSKLRTAFANRAVLREKSRTEQ
jgi:hypothetical protein